MDQHSKIHILDTSANPGALGLFGFGMTTILLNLHNAGLYTLDSMILAMGIFYGGIAQIIAGILEYKKGNTFGLTAFISYGSFWLTLVFLLIAPKMGWWQKPDGVAMISYFILWGIFTLVMFVGTLKLNRALQFIFGSLVILYFLLALRDITGSAVIGAIAGWEGIICGFSAFYTGFAQVLNEVSGKTVLPIGPVNK